MNLTKKEEKNVHHLLTKFHSACKKISRFKWKGNECEVSPLWKKNIEVKHACNYIALSLATRKLTSHISMTAWNISSQHFWFLYWEENFEKLGNLLFVDVMQVSCRFQAKTYVLFGSTCPLFFSGVLCKEVNYFRSSFSSLLVELLEFKEPFLVLSLMVLQINNKSIIEAYTAQPRYHLVSQPLSEISLERRGGRKRRKKKSFQVFLDKMFHVSDLFLWSCQSAQHGCTMPCWNLILHNVTIVYSYIQNSIVIVFPWKCVTFIPILFKFISQHVQHAPSQKSSRSF